MLAPMTDTPEDRWEAAEEAAERLKDGDPEGAVSAAEDVLRLDPRNEYAWFFLGCAHFEKSELGSALKAFVRALEIAPGYLGAMVNLGHTLRLLGRHDEAIRLGRELLTRAPEDGDALYLLGLTYFARGDSAAATSHLERFLNTRPEAETALEVSGMLQTLRGEVIPFPGVSEPSDEIN
jgi:cytochrome c-type biogenesis protein CcmH/NrfG